MKFLKDQIDDSFPVFEWLQVDGYQSLVCSECLRIFFRPKIVEMDTKLIIVFMKLLFVEINNVWIIHSLQRNMHCCPEPKLMCQILLEPYCFQLIGIIYAM